MQYANHAAEEQIDFYSVLYNLVLSDFSEKDVIAQLISSKKNQTESNKSLTYQLLIQATNIEILIQHGTGIMVQTTQETVEARMKKYES